MVYLDTSVIAAYYCPEPNSGIVEKIILQLKQPAISDLTELELASAVSRKIREKNLSREDAVKIISLFQSHVAQGMFQKISVQPEHYQIAASWITRFTTALRTLDALHLAVAGTHNATALTADVQLVKAARHFGVSVKLLSRSCKV
jgi:hypothetical protein